MLVALALVLAAALFSLAAFGLVLFFFNYSWFGLVLYFAAGNELGNNYENIKTLWHLN